MFLTISSTSASDKVLLDVWRVTRLKTGVFHSFCCFFELLRGGRGLLFGIISTGNSAGSACLSDLGEDCLFSSSIVGGTVGAENDRYLPSNKLSIA